MIVDHTGLSKLAVEDIELDSIRNNLSIKTSLLVSTSTRMNEVEFQNLILFFQTQVFAVTWSSFSMTILSSETVQAES